MSKIREEINKANSEWNILIKKGLSLKEFPFIFIYGYGSPTYDLINNTVEKTFSLELRKT